MSELQLPARVFDVSIIGGRLLGNGFVAGVRAGQDNKLQEGALALLAVNPVTIDVSPKSPRMHAALALAIAADLVQLVAFPLFIEGAASPMDDLLDLGMAGILTYLLGWHWEFAPSFVAKLVPGVDLVPLWTLAVANVYRKAKQIEPAAPGPVIEGQPVRKQ